MDVKAKAINDVLIGMNQHIDGTKLDILKCVIERVFSTLTITQNETLPSTEMDSNTYILQLYEARKKNKISEKSYNYYVYSINNLINFTGKSLLHMQDYDIDDYLNYYESKGNSACTVNNERRNISAFFGWMRKSRMITFNPCENVETRKQIQKPIDYLEGYELEELRDGCIKLRERAILEFLRSSGVRAGECVSVNIKDIDFKTGDIQVFATKTGQYRMVFLDDIAKYHVKKYIDSRTDDHEALFVSERKPFNRADTDGLRRSLKKIAERVDMNRRVYPHLMRKTLATTMRANGCPDSMIQATLGHAPGSPVTDKFYAATNTEQLRTLHNRYGVA